MLKNPLRATNNSLWLHYYRIKICIFLFHEYTLWVGVVFCGFLACRLLEGCCWVGDTHIVYFWIIIPKIPKIPKIPPVVLWNFGLFQLKKYTCKKTRTLLIIFIYNVYCIFFLIISKYRLWNYWNYWNYWNFHYSFKSRWLRRNYYSTWMLPITSASERISVLRSVNGAKLGLSEWQTMHSSSSDGWMRLTIGPSSESRT